MATVRNSDVIFFPFHARLKTQANARTVPLGDVNARWSAWRRSDYFYPEMIPEPDYSDSESDDDETKDESNDESGTKRERIRNRTNKNKNEKKVPLQDKTEGRIPKSDITSRPQEISRPQKHQELDEELIKPKKPVHPFPQSEELQKLHKELKFNQKYGKQKEGKKTELQKALEKYNESKVKKDLIASRRSSLDKILEQQARKIEMREKEGTINDQPAWIEDLQRQHITKSSDPQTDEFYRVHARVVSNLMNNNDLSKDDDQSTSDSSSRRSSSPTGSND